MHTRMCVSVFEYDLSSPARLITRPERSGYFLPKSIKYTTLGLLTCTGQSVCGKVLPLGAGAYIDIVFHSTLVLTNMAGTAFILG